MKEEQQHEGITHLRVDSMKALMDHPESSFWGLIVSATNGLYEGNSSPEEPLDSKKQNIPNSLELRTDHSSSINSATFQSFTNSKNLVAIMIALTEGVLDPSKHSVVMFEEGTKLSGKDL